MAGRSWVVVVVGLVIVIVTTTRPAEACTGSQNDPVAAIVLLGATYVGVTAGFAIESTFGHEHSRVYGAAEAIVNVPIAVGFGIALGHEVLRLEREKNREAATFLALGTALHAALAIHGAYTVVRRREPRRIRAVIDPAWVGIGGTF